MEDEESGLVVLSLELLLEVGLVLAETGGIRTPLAMPPFFFFFFSIIGVFGALGKDEQKYI